MFILHALLFVIFSSPSCRGLAAEIVALFFSFLFLMVNERMVNTDVLGRELLKLSLTGGIGLSIKGRALLPKISQMDPKIDGQGSEDEQARYSWISFVSL